LLGWAIINGLSLGAIYLLVTLGLALIYGVLEIPDFSQAGLYVLGAYLVYSGMTYVGLNYIVSLLVSLGFVIAIGIGIERFTYRPTQHKAQESLLIVALGLLFVLDNTALLLWGHQHKTISISRFVGKALVIGDISFFYTRAFAILTAGVLALIIHFVLMRTKTGDAIRAIIQNREGAILMGIKIGRIRSITFAISCILVTIAGSLIGAIFSIYPYMGDYIIVKAFGAIILGGMGSIFGAAVGALIIGFTESFGATYVSPAYKDFFSFVIIILVLIFRPWGIFGTKERVG